MRVKWYGTATVSLEQDGTQLLFDPFVPQGKMSFAPPWEEFTSADNILATHGHLDHILAIPAIMERGGGSAAVYCTAAPRETLIAKGVPEERIRLIAPNDTLILEPFVVRVLKGKHITADKRLILRTLINPRVLVYRRNIGYLAKENKICVEAGETVVYDVSASSKRVIMMGSLNLDEKTEYPTEADLLILPFQGRSDMGNYAMAFIKRLRPKKIMLIHFDDAFPPISSAVNTKPFISQMRRKHPNLTVIRPIAGGEWAEID